MGAPFAPAVALSTGTYTAYKVDQQVDMIWDYYKPQVVDFVADGYEIGMDAVNSIRKYFD
ncbi:hypothetical protein [Photobacterium sp. GB-1]|uniref:hypothetical protein n=1 Tax=Photobacterium sp. GB-1 TaxID=2022111 RepID=UPI0011B29CCC|nr:hypothetical protein [Photobacterium sp. GB-1]